MSHDVTILGPSGPPVLLLPGGAEAADGFFPGLAEGLVAEPGCRVLLHDRPGTGTATEDGPLDGATAHLHAVLTEAGVGPTVVVGQSLGGAVAVLLARDYPEDVAGLVLLDPTPINDARACPRIEQTAGAIGRLASLPVAGRAVSAGFRRLAAHQMRDVPLRPDCAVALERTAGADLAQLGRAVRGLGRLSAGLRESDLPKVPAVVVTAERPADSSIRQAHQRLATAFGGSLVSWPGATHSVHLDHPDEVLEVVRSVVGEVANPG